jgi:hypothetical protein
MKVHSLRFSFAICHILLIAQKSAAVLHADGQQAVHKSRRLAGALAVGSSPKRIVILSEILLCDDRIYAMIGLSHKNQEVLFLFP